MNDKKKENGGLIILSPVGAGHARDCGKIAGMARSYGRNNIDASS